MLSWLDEKAEKNYEDSDLTLLLNRDETCNLSWGFLQHISVGTCPLHTEIEDGPSALVGDVEINPYTLSLPPTDSASGSCTSKSCGSSIHAIFLISALLSAFLSYRVEPRQIQKATSDLRRIFCLQQYLLYLRSGYHWDWYFTEQKKMGYIPAGVG